MTEVYRNSRTSLQTTVSEDKYFYLTNSNYYPHSNYIYICFEDNNYGLSDIGVKYCPTNTDPGSYPNKAVSGCFFSTLYYYYKQSSSGTIKYYYYKISTSNSNYYTIVNYQGGYSEGKLYATTDYNDLVPKIQMTQVSRNSRTSLPTTSSANKYFYFPNSNYNDNYTNYIYILFEDNNFGLKYDNIKYCRTDANIGSYPDNAVSSCSFIPISYYSTQSSPSTIKYYYKVSNTMPYTYSIVYYEGSYSSGSLYVTIDYNDLAKTVKMTQVSRNSTTSLPTSSSYNKYFYLINSDYFLYSHYIYICLEDNNFGLNYNNIKYCFTNTNPSSYDDSEAIDCSFHSLYYSNNQSSSGTIKYYYQISNIDSYNYSIVYYEGSEGISSSGNLYVTSDYNDFIQTVKMTEVSRNLRISLPTINSEDKYFYLTNRIYSNYSNYIYICLEDNNFDLNYNNIKYCFTNTNPSDYPDIAVKSCSFISISYYSSQSSSGTIKYYYKFSNTSFYTYSIVYYEGKNSSGNLYVTSDYNDFIQTVKMTEVSRNSRTSLPTSIFEDKYFYLTNRIYSNYSNYIYICLEDNNFDLKYNNIKYCFTNTNPYINTVDAVNNCSFNLISYYNNNQSSSGTIKYYYNISNTSFYTYSIVYYEGKNSFGNLYVTIDYKNISSDDNKDDDKDDNKRISTVAIIGIVSGSIAILVTFILITYCYFKCCGKNKIDSIADPSNQPENLLPNDNPNIP